MKLLIFTFLFIFFQINLLHAQNKEDVELLRNSDFKQSVYNSRKVIYGFSENPSKFSLYNPLYHLLSGSMYVYQKNISPQLSSQCLYVPSCSEYSKQLIRDYGITKGVFCSADRIMRCNRIAVTGLPRDIFNKFDKKIHESTKRYFFND